MSSCTCSPELLATVTFSNGTVLLRCAAHESQQWLVDGAPVGTAQALAELRTLFVEQRDNRRTRRTTRRATVIHLPEPVTFAEPRRSGRVDDASLTAMLHARGLPGTWAVA